MIFIDAPYDNSTGLYRRKISTCGKVEMGIYPVMFGFRIRAGYSGKMWTEIDYCAGSDPVMVTIIYHSVLSFLSCHGDDFKSFPKQDVKPMQNDPVCLQKILDLIKDCHIEETTRITSEDLAEYRRSTIEENFNN